MTALVALSACVRRIAPKPEDYRPQAMPGVVVPENWVAGDKETGPVAGEWLAAFGDARLDALIDEGIAHNPDLQVAAARVRLHRSTSSSRVRRCTRKSAHLPVAAGRWGAMRRDCREVPFSSTGSWISGAACAPRVPPTRRVMRRPLPTPSTPGNR